MTAHTLEASNSSEQPDLCRLFQPTRPMRASPQSVNRHKAGRSLDYLCCAPGVLACL